MTWRERIAPFAFAPTIGRLRPALGIEKLSDRIAWLPDETWRAVSIADAAAN